MKRSAKLLALAVALFAGFGTSTAQAEGFKTGVDLVSSYVWRGTEFGDSPAIQPSLNYTFSNGVVVGAWGSYGVQKFTSVSNGDYRYQEVDLSLTIPAGPFSLTAVDYYVPNPSTVKSFDFSKTGPNIIEIDGAYSSGNLSLLAAINVAGPDTNNAKYFEAGYKFYSKDGYSAKGVAGVGSKYFYGNVGGTEEKLALVNTGISVSKDKFTAGYVYNPISELSNLVFTASF